MNVQRRLSVRSYVHTYVCTLHARCLVLPSSWLAQSRSSSSATMYYSPKHARAARQRRVGLLRGTARFTLSSSSSIVASLFEVSVRSFVRSIPSPLLLPNKDQRSWEQFQQPPHGGASGLGSEGKGNKVQNASFSATRVGCVCSAHKISLGMFPYLESPTPYGRPSVSPLFPSLKSQGTFGR